MIKRNILLSLILSFCLFSPTLAHADTDVNAYITNFTAAGGTLTTGQVTAITNFITSAKANGYWNYLLDIHPYIGTTISQVSVKLKTAPGAPTSLINHGFTNSAILSSGGIQGNGSSYFDTGINQSAMVASTAGLGGLSVWIASDYTPHSLEWLIGIGDGSSYQTNLELDNGCSFQGKWGNGTTCLNGLVGNVIPHGFYQSEKQTLSSLQFVVNGVEANVDTSTSTSTDPYGGDITTFASGTNYPTSAPMSFSAVDNGGMTNTQMTSYAHDVAQLEIALGRVVPDSGNMNYSIIIGQSLAAQMGTTFSGTSTVPVYSALTKGGGVDSVNTGDNPSSLYGDILGLLTPLVYPGNDNAVLGFTSFIGNEWRQQNPRSDAQDPVVTDYGQGSTPYTGLEKGTLPYSNSIAAIAAAKFISPIYRTGTFQVPGIINIHGESDMEDAPGTYEADLIQWQSDYQNDIQAITGQTSTIPMFTAQPSAWTAVGNANYATGNSPYDILAAYETNPTKLILVTPEYFLPHNSTDGVHLTTPGYRTLAEYYAKAWYKTIILGQPYSPLRPVAETISGKYINVSFTGNVNPLQWDTTLVTDPGNHGFEYYDDSSSASIATTTITGSSTVLITLNQVPTGTNQRIRYAYTGIAGNNGGPTTGPRGNLRDSDPTLSLYDDNNDGILDDHLYNWTVHFDKVLTSAGIPSVSSSSASSITATGVVLNSALTADGNASSTIEGFNYGSSLSYGTAASSTGTFGVGAFSQNLISLACGMTYHYQAFATNYAGTATSSDQTFTTSPCPSVSSSNISSFEEGSTASPSQLASVLAPSAAATAYLNSLGAQASSPACPSGFTCTPITGYVSSVSLPASAVFTTNLQLGATGPEVKSLQEYLNANGYTIASTGPGSPGSETNTFGSLTKAALMRFQKAHDLPMTGYFGPMTRGVIQG